jgi:serine/threonine-protein kinase
MVLALTLEKRPELRYASGQQLAQDLEAVLDAGIKEARKTSGAGTKPAEPDTSGTTGNSAPAAFAQTQRIELGEAVQNRAPPPPPKSNGP